ncbi:MAG TPA: hypothetical protein V6D12_21900 [Candidatus Obscuribacterales bacterium]
MTLPSARIHRLPDSIEERFNEPVNHQLLDRVFLIKTRFSHIVPRLIR